MGVVVLLINIIHKFFDVGRNYYAALADMDGYFNQYIKINH